MKEGDRESRGERMREMEKRKIIEENNIHRREGTIKKETDKINIK